MTSQRPTRRAGGSHEDYVEEHPAYGVIGAARVSSGGGAPLFGSDFLHQNYVVIRVSHAKLSRGLSHDWVNSDGRWPIVELALSEAQWATFVSTLNSGEGTPCTLYLADGEQVPGIEPDLTRREQYRDEVDEHLQEALSLIDEVLAGKPSAKDRTRLERARMQLTSNLAFVAKSFDRHAEATIEKAKIEVAAYVSGALRRAGLAAIGNEQTIELIEEKP